jgi:2-oxoglutarate ferredoxin oxidoreductase subunit beta
LVHDEAADEPYLALILSRMFWPEFPVPVGVLRATVRPTHDRLIEDQLAAAVAKSGVGDLADVLNGGETWTVEE